eukprot:6204175-Pleurochrysis_carterae.AAC.1
MLNISSSALIRHAHPTRLRPKIINFLRRMRVPLTGAAPALLGALVWALRTATPAPLNPSRPPRVLTADERARFIVSPELIASVDRQLMESILSTIEIQAALIPYRARSK